MFLSNNMKNLEMNKLKKPNILRKKPKAVMQPYLTASLGKPPCLKPQDMDTEYRPIIRSNKIVSSVESDVTTVDPHQTLSIYEDSSNNNGCSNIFNNILELTGNDYNESVILCTSDTFLIPVVDSLEPTMRELEESLLPPVKFRCDVEDCIKEFSTKQNLKKHKARHNKNIDKASKQQLSCPAYKTGEACDRTFTVKEDLVNHLKTDHTLEDAPHGCPKCSRRFFWASGSRAHQRACGGGRRRAPLACPWEGCGRVFQQPCRLREHARAHNGDRPYPCLYPNCGWSFRTASKLVRHERAHTGERRHRCATCGAQFSRSEHLREHAGRHERARRLPPAPAKTAAHACPGCTETFLDPSSLALHAAAHHAPPTAPSAPVTAPRLAPRTAPRPRAEWRAARTHCTWPLEPFVPSPPSPPPAQAEATESEGGEGGEGEGADGAVRRDLFLMGALQDETTNGGVEESCSEFSGSEGGGGAAGEGGLGTPLGLLDHPTIDLMQEELYADAVDGSSFHVLLLDDGI